MKVLRGFTLIELIVVMGILAILATIVVIAVNPGRQFAASRNAKRASDTRAIAQAINQHAADNGGQVVGSISSSAKTIGTTVGANYVDLTSILVPNYLSVIPTDPSNGTAADTRYLVYLTTNGQVVVQSAAMELGKVVSTNPGFVLNMNGTAHITMGSQAGTCISDPSLCGGALTAEVWTKSNSTSPGTVYIMSSGSQTSSRGFSIRQVNGTLEFDLKNGATQWAIANVSYNPLDWNHIALVWNGSTLMAYVNGVQRGTHVGGAQTVADAQTIFTIGVPNNVSCCYYQGQIDEVRISNVVRYSGTFSQSRRLFEDVSTLGMWHFDEGVGTAAADSSGNNRTGSFTNSPTWLGE